MILNRIPDGVFVVIQCDEVFNVGQIFRRIGKSKIANARIEVRQRLRGVAHDLFSGLCRRYEDFACISIILGCVDGRHFAIEYCNQRDTVLLE